MQLLKEMMAYQFTATPPKLLTNNTIAATSARNHVLHQRAKHIEIGIHSIRGRVVRKEVTLAHIDMKLNIVDLVTKLIVGTFFQSLVKTLGLLELHRPVSTV